ncbi:MAG: response regulator [Chloroflexota bacterium]|nr:response regulator [Chloroflexota bacterium]
MKSSTGEVLVIDDDDTIREVISLTLEDEGYAVLTAPNGAVALELVYQSQPKLILLDMRMPVMDGWAFSEAYRQLPGTHAPIIVLTAATDATLFASQIQADSCLPKPFDLNQLIELVERYIS